jgi:hypothetical protein
MRLNNNWLPLFLILTGFFCYVNPAMGQSDWVNHDKLYQALVRMKPGQMIRIKTPTDSLFQGVFIRFDSKIVTVASEEQLKHISYTVLQDIKIYQSNRHAGARIGAVAGGIVGIALGFTIGEQLCDNEDCQTNTFQAVSKLGLMGYVTGTFSGMVIGSVIPRWKQVYP